MQLNTKAKRAVVASVASLVVVTLAALFGNTCWAAGAPKSLYEAKVRSALNELATNQTNVSFLLSLTNLPKAVHAKLGVIADAGQPYSDGCIGKEPRRRFILATKVGQTYNVAFEQGGFIPMWHIFKFDVDKDGKIIREQEIQPNSAVNRSLPVVVHSTGCV